MNHSISYFSEYTYTYIPHNESSSLDEGRVKRLFFSSLSQRVVFAVHQFDFVRRWLRLHRADCPTFGIFVEHLGRDPPLALHLDGHRSSGTHTAHMDGNTERFLVRSNNYYYTCTGKSVHCEERAAMLDAVSNWEITLSQLFFSCFFVYVHGNCKTGNVHSATFVDSLFFPAQAHCRGCFDHDRGCLCPDHCPVGLGQQGAPGGDPPLAHAGGILQSLRVHHVRIRRSIHIPDDSSRHEKEGEVQHLRHHRLYK